MPTAGRACLIIALAVCLYGIAVSLYGARSGRRELVASGRRAVYVLAGLLVVAMAILQSAFVRSDFGYALVASHSSTTTPLFYRLTAVWSSQEGSLLLWAAWRCWCWMMLVASGGSSAGALGALGERIAECTRCACAGKQSRRRRPACDQD